MVHAPIEFFIAEAAFEVGGVFGVDGIPVQTVEIFI
jgi:hypothetical protein